MRKYPYDLVAFLLLSLALAGPQQVFAQSDPLNLPTPRPASKGAYQWGTEMLKMEAAWALTRGRAHLSIVDSGFFAHPELQPGVDGNYRDHLSQLTGPQVTVPGADPANFYHGLMTAGTMAARGANGIGISGACPWCSVSFHEYSDANGIFTALGKAIASGASVVNMSIGTGTDGKFVNDACQTAVSSASSSCSVLRRAAERDLVIVSITGNNANAGGGPTFDGVGFPANFPSVIAVGGLESDGSFWTHGYEPSNAGSNWGPKLRLVAPAKDLLVLHTQGRNLYGPAGKSLRCGDRVDSTVGQDTTLPASYAGYGDCSGTSFAAPMVSGIAGLMRSANPLLTAAEVQTILYETATRPVAGPVGSGLTFYIPDAEAAVQRALGAGQKNRISPLFALFSPSDQAHLFTSSPQTAVAAVAGDFGPTSFQSIGGPVSHYPQFSGKICDTAGNNCAQTVAGTLFGVFTTETSPLPGRGLAPLYRMTQVCTVGAAGCKSGRAFAYAVGREQALALEGRGYRVDVVEGFLFATDGVQPVDTVPVCLGFDSVRIDYVLYPAAAGTVCTANRLQLEGGRTTGGNYQSSLVGYAPTLAQSLTDYTDMWWAGEGENGWGVSITQHGLTQFAVLFVYDVAGKPIWYAMPGGGWNAQYTSYTGNLYLPTSAPFSNYSTTAFRPNASVGTATLTYSSASTAVLSYTINGVSGSKNIKRQLFTVDDGSARLRVNDLWWGGDAQNGWGLNIAQQGATLFPLWYTYDANGKDTWFAVPGGTWTGNSFTGDLVSVTSSPWLGAPYNPAAFAPVKRGSMTLNFASPNAATMTYTVDGITQSKPITRQPF